MKHAAIVLLCLSVLVAGCSEKNLDGTGLVKVSILNDAPLIEVNMKYFKNFEQELGLSFSIRLQNLYKLRKEVDLIRVKVNLPHTDQYGKVTWREKVSFGFSRALYEKINWANFDARTLLKVAHDVVRN